MEELDQIVLALTNTPNWLSKRITPQRDMSKVNRPAERGGMSVRDIIAQMRDNEARYFPKMHLISIAQVPDLRRVQQVGPTEYDPNDSVFTVMSQFRRIRQSTLSLLRELPHDAWNRVGVDVDNVTVSIKDLALELIGYDNDSLAHVDAVLIARGALPHGVRPLVAVETGV
jgi:hypothetical protein